MRLKKYCKSGLLLALFGSFLFSCSKMDSTYADFIRDGEIVFTARVDSVKTFPGNNRIDLSMLLLTDPKISKVKVFWSAGTGKDSSEKAVQRTAGVDTVRFSLRNLAEGTYTFNVYTYDNAGHRSVKTDLIGTVYGEKYTSSLVNRTIRTATYVDSLKSGVVKWIGVGSEVIGQELKYTDTLGVDRTVFTPYASAVDSVSVLPSFKKGISFRFRTLYKPAPSAVDTFYSAYESRLVP
jgi:hypothetical protein